MRSLLSARRVRVIGLVAAAMDAAVSGGVLVGPAATGAKLTVSVTVTSASGGAVPLYGVLAYAAVGDQVVIGHFASTVVNVPVSGGAATAELSTESPIASIYAGQSVEVLIGTDPSLGSAAVGTAVASLQYQDSFYVPISRGTILSSPYFVPAAIAAGVLAAGAAAIIVIE